MSSFLTRSQGNARDVQYDTLIIGGGINGMLTARELQQAGQKILLIDRQACGREASWAGGGIISPLYPWRYADSVTALARWGQARYQHLCQELAEATGIDPEWTPNGLLMISPEEQVQAQRWALERDYPLRLVNSSEISEIEPQLASPTDSGIWMEQTAQVRNPRLAKALRRDIELRGIEIREGVTAHEFLLHKGRIEGIRSSDGRLQADNVLVAAGAWSGKLLAELPHPPGIQPVRGQMILFRTPPGLISRITLEEDRYIIPRRDGRVLFGSTVEHTGFEKRTSREALDELQQIATTRFPALKNCPIETQWAGLRPGSPSGIPYIGEHPAVPGLYINAGQFRNGVVLGPASARLTADLVLGRKPVVDPAAYALNANRN